MPVSVAFRFPGRYHATPFGHHVNEGLVEWPPSPWRLLRALISVGYTTGVWDEAGPSPAAEGMIAKLSAGLPHYVLPSAVGAHTRHYMPIGELEKKKPEKTTLVFDTWLVVKDRELIVTWPDAQLNNSERSTLERLAGRLNYLGRSESWVEARVVGRHDPVPLPNCAPEQNEATRGPGWEQVALLAPQSVSGYEVWRQAKLDDALADLPIPEARKPSKALLNKRAKAKSPYPPTLLDCLQMDTTWLRSHGWSRPPGSQRVFYCRRSDAVSVSAPRAKIAGSPLRRVKAMLLSLTNASRNDHALPPVTRTLPQAELLHRTLVGIAARSGVPPRELTGRDQNRRPLQGAHEHAHINPLDLDDDGHLDHILIWAPGGLGTDAQAAIRHARRTYAKGVAEPLRIALVGSGDVADLACLPSVYGRRMARLAGGAMVWESVTPFVPPRHIKARGKNTLEGQIRTELLSRGLPRPTSVQCILPTSAKLRQRVRNETAADTQDRFRHFVRSRQRGPQPPVVCGLAIRLEFQRDVYGPIAIGYGSHFGLGLFAHKQRD